jgi:hypothetical protein
MVAPKRWPRKPKRRKWRQHCSTCGKKIEPNTWAYCSKECERNRLGSQDQDPMREDAVDRFLQLDNELPHAPVHLRAEIKAEMAKLLADREEPVDRPQLAPKDAIPDSQAEFWVAPIRREADRFEMAMRRSLAVAIKLGELLLDAKEKLAHGEFGRLFSDHERPVAGAMTFGIRWAQKLMAIASSPVLTNANRESHLPADLNTVYQMTRLDDDRLDAAIKAGDIHPKMRREDVRGLLPAAPEPAGETTEEPDPVEKLLDPFRLRLAAFAADHPELFGQVRSRMKAILRATQQVAEGATT